MIYKDLRPIKQNVINYINATWPEESGNYPAKDRMDVDKLAGLRDICREMHVDKDKLHALLKSQIMSGNIKGAVKVVQGCPDQKFNQWGYLLISPITVPITIVLMIISAPVHFVKWIGRNI